jgi:hypothetical protein
MAIEMERTPKEDIMPRPTGDLYLQRGQKVDYIYP